MSDHKDLRDFAWAYYTSDNYEEMADKLDCSVGTISVWKSKHGDKLDEFTRSDFTEKNPDPDEVESDSIETILRESFDYELEKNGTLLKNSNFGFVVDIDGNISEVAGSNLNPFVAISEHMFTDDWVEKCTDNNVGLIVVSSDGITVEVDATVTQSSGMRAILQPEAATTFDKYLSVAWLEYAINNGYNVVDISEECSVSPRTVRSTLEEFGLDSF